MSDLPSEIQVWGEMCIDRTSSIRLTFLLFSFVIIFFQLCGSWIAWSWIRNLKRKPTRNWKSTQWQHLNSKYKNLCWYLCRKRKETAATTKRSGSNFNGEMKIIPVIFRDADIVNKKFDEWRILAENLEESVNNSVSGEKWNRMNWKMRLVMAGVVTSRWPRPAIKQKRFSVTNTSARFGAINYACDEF